jgi:WD40 repeat protein
VRGESRQTLHVLDKDRRFSEHAPTCFGFSPNGALLATGERDGRVLIWNAETGVLILTMEDHQHGHERNHAVVDLVFSPSGLLVASSDAHGKVVIWEPRFSKNAHPLVLRQLALFASGTHDGVLPAVLQPVDDGDVKNIGLEMYLKRAQTYDLASEAGVSLNGVVQAQIDDPRLLELRPADSSLRSFREEIANEAYDRLQAVHKRFFQTKDMVRYSFRLPNPAFGRYIQRLSWTGSRATPDQSKLVGIWRNEITVFEINDTARPAFSDADLDPDERPKSGSRPSLFSRLTASRSSSSMLSISAKPKDGDDVAVASRASRRSAPLIPSAEFTEPPTEADEGGPTSSPPTRSSSWAKVAAASRAPNPMSQNTKRRARAIPMPETLHPTTVYDLATGDLEHGGVHRLDLSPDGSCAFVSTARGAKYLLPRFAEGDGSLVQLVAPVEKLRSSLVSPACLVTFAEGSKAVVVGCWDGLIYAWDYATPAEPRLVSMWERLPSASGYTPVPAEVQHSGKFQRGRWRDSTVPERQSGAAKGRSSTLDDAADTNTTAPVTHQLGGLSGPNDVKAGSSATASRSDFAGESGRTSFQSRSSASTSSTAKRVKGLDLDCMYDTCNTLAWMCSGSG